jgi:hypothetical protein
MGLSLRAYARHRHVTLSAVQKAVKTGRIVRGPDGIDPVAADRAWAAATAPRAPTMSAARRRAAGVSGRARSDERTFQRARAEKMVVEAKREALELRLREGALLDRDLVLGRVFSFMRQVRDAWQAWPARVGAELAEQFGIDRIALTLALDDQIHAQLEELATHALDLPTGPLARDTGRRAAS